MSYVLLCKAEASPPHKWFFSLHIPCLSWFSNDLEPSSHFTAICQCWPSQWPAPLHVTHTSNFNYTGRLRANAGQDGLGNTGTSISTWAMPTNQQCPCAKCALTVDMFPSRVRHHSRCPALACQSIFLHPPQSNLVAPSPRIGIMHAPIREPIGWPSSSHAGGCHGLQPMTPCLWPCCPQRNLACNSLSSTQAGCSAGRFCRASCTASSPGTCAASSSPWSASSRLVMQEHQ